MTSRSQNLDPGHLRAEGCTILCLGCPDTMHFGIDFSSWKTGPKFMGVNCIPPGVHFVYYASTADEDYAERTGFWVHLRPRQVLVRSWDTETELFTRLDEDSELRYSEGVRQYDFDHNLGPYPVDNYSNWCELTRHMTMKTLQRVEPIDKNVSMKSQEYNPDTKDGLDGMEPFKANTSTLFFSTIPKLAGTRRTKLHGTDLTNFYMDKTELLEQMLTKITWKELLGELEMSFIVFVLGQNFDGFEYWKEVVLLLSGCQSAIIKYEEMYSEFIRILFTHLQKAPEDFFMDDLTSSNFLTRSISDLLEICEDAASQKIRQRAQHLAALVQKRFGCTWQELDDEQPTVVELTPEQLKWMEASMET